jgi:hypothetical protein
MDHVKWIMTHVETHYPFYMIHYALTPIPARRLSQMVPA